MQTNIKIRGIYTTALTKFFIDKGVTIISPSKAIAAKFTGYGNLAFDKPFDATISDRNDEQGITIKGSAHAIHAITEFMRKSFIDAIFRKKQNEGGIFLEIEFAALTKFILDELRATIAPTILNHHRLRLINSRYVDLIEAKELPDHPEKRDGVSRDLEKTLIWDSYKRGKELAIDHVKLNGEVISLSEGEIMESNQKEKKLILKRKKFKGRQRYDGLNIPKEKGDYAVTEVTEGDFFYRHSYFRHDGRQIGEYCNINTPVEFYPDKIRYVDLEIDVVKWPGGNVKIIDEAELDRYASKGYIGSELQAKAIETARQLCR